MCSKTYKTSTSDRFFSDNERIGNKQDTGNNWKKTDELQMLRLMMDGFKNKKKVERMCSMPQGSKPKSGCK